MTAPVRIAFFISPHGYGHAARAAAVMEAIHHLDPAVSFEIYTRVPNWFFTDSLAGTFTYHPLLTDIGLAQKSSLAEDLPETIRQLDRFLPFEQAQIERLAQQVTNAHCRLVVCDIAPMGLAVAQTAGIPAVLIENFTWDWIYEGYLPTVTTPRLAEELKRHIDYLHRWFKAADYHIQTEPVGRPTARADLVTGPISRPLRESPHQVRKALGLPDQAKMVMVTMGGIPWHYTFLEQLYSRDSLYFVIPGADKATQITDQENILLLPHQSDFYHPDLINAADVVIGKAGYSTVAEVHQAGVPFGYVVRSNFRESEALVAYIKAEIAGLAISETVFRDGRWLSALPELLAMPRTPRPELSNANRVARFILQSVVRQVG